MGEGSKSLLQGRKRASYSIIPLILGRMMKVDRGVFRENDIRGVVGEGLTPEFAHLLGRGYGALARSAGKNRIGIGWDCRLSSEEYANNLARGIAAQGVDVVMTGLGPTPQLYYAIFAEELGGGIQVTGSHNPADMNGFKLCLGRETLSGKGIQELYQRVIEEQVVEHAGDETVGKPGTILSLPIRERYTQMLIQNSKPGMGARPLRVVVDAGNGVGGLVGPALLRGLGVEVVELFCEPDGRFPNHHPDPTELKNIETLAARVVEEGADFGIGWDGDADRIGVVDERGVPIYGDMLLLIFARALLKEKPGATVIGDVKCSSILFEDLAERGARPIMWKTGHSLVKAKLKEEGADLAGEMSGHIFFKHRYFGFDDALYASARFCEVVSNWSGPVSTILSDIPPMKSTPEIRVDCPDDIKFRIAEEAKSAFADYPVDTTDGARVRFPEGWGLVRASNTQPVLVLRFEAETQEGLEEYQRLMVGAIEGIKEKLAAEGTLHHPELP